MEPTSKAHSETFCSSQYSFALRGSLALVGGIERNLTADPGDPRPQRLIPQDQVRGSAGSNLSQLVQANDASRIAGAHRPQLIRRKLEPPGKISYPLIHRQR